MVLLEALAPLSVDVGSGPLAATFSGIVWGISRNVSGASVVVFWRWTTTLHGRFAGPSLAEYSSSSNPSFNAENKCYIVILTYCSSHSSFPILSFLFWRSFEGNLLPAKGPDGGVEGYNNSNNIHDKMLLTPALLLVSSSKIMILWYYLSLWTLY